MFKLIFRTFVKLILVLFIVLAVLVLGNLYTYKRLVDEEPIAQLTFKPVKEQEFDAVVRLGNFCDSKVYKLYGDEWRMDAQFLKWKSWTTLFGIDAMYRVERLSGRYKEIGDANSKQHSAHSLTKSSTLNISDLAKRYSGKFSIVDTVYGSSAYEKMVPNTQFIVFRTQSGILIRQKELSKNSQPPSCANSKSKWKDTIVKMDQKLVSLLHSLQIFPK